MTNYLIHYVINSKLDEFKHIHKSFIINFELVNQENFKINDINDFEKIESYISLKTKLNTTIFNITIVGINKL